MADHTNFDTFVATIAALRAPDGCPWDRAQTHQSIAHNMIEEAYETADAIEANDVAHLREELGDMMLQVVLQSQIAADAGEFTIDDICADINAKMIRRHPHVFGEAHADSASEVLDLWDQVKLSEKNEDRDAAEGKETQSASGENQGAASTDDRKNAAECPAGLLDDIPTSFPALMQAQKVSRKAAAVGFEWDTIDDIWAKVKEETDELTAAYAAAPKAVHGKVDKDGQPHTSNAEELVANVEDEMGDVFFSLVNVARRMGVNSESALRSTCMKFRRRWSHMEKQAWRQGLSLEDLSTDQLEMLWTEAKQS